MIIYYDVPAIATPQKKTHMMQIEDMIKAKVIQWHDNGAITSPTINKYHWWCSASVDFPQTDPTTTKQQIKPYRMVTRA